MQQETYPELKSWYAPWVGLKIAVFGLGETGFSVADTLQELGVEVCVFSQKHDETRMNILSILGVKSFFEDIGDDILQGLDLFSPNVIIVSPGFRPDHPWVLWGRKQQIPIWGDIELAWRVRDKQGAPAQWICITGTNGKTTTTQMAGHFLRAQGTRAAVCGNIGVPVLDMIRDPEGFEVLVVELSSYQLYWMSQPCAVHISPYSSVCLNLEADHIDWHGTMENYRDAKAQIYANTQIACVYNRADEQTRIMVEEADVCEGARAIGFGLDAPGPSDFGIVEGILCDRAFLEERQNTAYEITTLDQLKQQHLAFPHIVADLLAACALVRSYGVEIDVIYEALETFVMDDHRNQVVAVHHDVTWVNDSKATNMHAAEASLVGYHNIVWIVGGLFKGIDVHQAVVKNRSRLRAVIFIGRDRTYLHQVFLEHAPSLERFEVEHGTPEEVMSQVVAVAALCAKPGDTVLFAPAGASFDQFDDYRHRGEIFMRAVREYVQKG